jgi:solute carrier family 25 (peroxisomal adenine nucleotide transporter), member 17
MSKRIIVFFLIPDKTIERSARAGQHQEGNMASSTKRATENDGLGLILRHALIIALIACCLSLYYLKTSLITDDEESQEASSNNNSLTQQQQQQQQSNVIHALSGSLGSALSITIFYPLETVRTRLQVDTSTTTPRWSFSLVCKIFQSEGLPGLYRGWLSLLIALTSLNFCYFYCFHSLRVWLVASWNHAGDASWRNVFHHYHLGHKMVVDLIAGYLAGCVAVIVTGPLWLVNTRLKLQGVSVGNRSRSGGVSDTKGGSNDKNQYNGIFHCLYTIYKQEGLLTLWKGTFTSIILSLNPAIQLAAYEMLKRRRGGLWWIVSTIIYHFRGNSSAGSSQENDHVNTDGSAMEHFTNALLSKFIATLITYPIQLIQTRQRWSKKTDDNDQQQQQQQQQLKTNIKPMKPKRWGAATIHDLKEIIQQQGVQGLYKGLEAKLMQTCLNSALMFVAYEKLVEFLTKACL